MCVLGTHLKSISRFLMRNKGTAKLMVITSEPQTEIDFLDEKGLIPENLLVLGVDRELDLKGTSSFDF